LAGLDAFLNDGTPEKFAHVLVLARPRSFFFCGGGGGEGAFGHFGFVEEEAMCLPSLPAQRGSLPI
jgi:hypothetical protein